jgi:hypothetical protein
VFGDQERHHEVRQQVVTWLRANEQYNGPDGPVTLSAFLANNRDWTSFTREVARDGTWGDHLSLIGAANVWQRPVWVLTTLPCSDDQAVQLIEPAPPLQCDTSSSSSSSSHDWAAELAGSSPIRLLHWAEAHYESLHAPEALRARL